MKVFPIGRRFLKIDKKLFRSMERSDAVDFVMGALRMAGFMVNRNLSLMALRSYILFSQYIEDESFRSQADNRGWVSDLWWDLQAGYKYDKAVQDQQAPS